MVRQLTPKKGGRALFSHVRIVILHKASDSGRLNQYSITSFAELWQQSGHQIIHLFGTKSYVEADMLLLHVNLSVVPDDYLAFAGRYPVALNTRVTDIRKRHISRIRVQAQDTYKGPVIVKSDLNYGGIPEENASQSKLRWAFWKNRLLSGRTSPSLHYPIYPSIAEVPSQVWSDPSVIVEKFLPEFEEGFYYLRHSYFLGGRSRSWRLRSAHPILRVAEILDDVEIPTPESVERYRREIGLDYGKIDFVEHENKITILDVNKTIGSPAPPESTPYLAPAIEAFFPNFHP